VYPGFSKYVCALCGSPLLEGELNLPNDAGIKHDEGKPRLDLLSTSWLEGVGKVLEFGAKKYGPNNWRKGIHTSRLIAAALRHIVAYNRGENLDKETNLSHLYHASCCLMFAAELAETKPELDDRYKTNG
jgi:hypothetical protein